MRESRGAMNSMHRIRVQSAVALLLVWTGSVAGAALADAPPEAMDSRDEKSTLRFVREGTTVFEASLASLRSGRPEAVVLP